jgi:tRNA (mo5U34)-methyltransferase
VPNRACAEAMLRSAGFQIVAHPEDEVYVCRRAERPHPAGAVYPTRGALA